MGAKITRRKGWEIVVFRFAAKKSEERWVIGAPSLLWMELSGTHSLLPFQLPQ
jgi:hypothetical protein